jgi:hypothetical protein
MGPEVRDMASNSTPRHFWRLDAWHTLFPDAQLVGSDHAAARETVEEAFACLERA